MRRLILILAVMGFLAGCAGRKPRPVVAAPPLVDVVAILERGCYACFVEAYETAVRQRQPRLALEAALLAALRSKELGMPPEAWMDRARVAAVAEPASAELIEMVAVVAPDVFSGDREFTAANPQERFRARTLLPRWRLRLAAGSESPVVRRYLEKALVCDIGGPAEREALLKGLGAGLPPLLEFAASVCGFADGQRLRQLVDGGFVDGEYALGQVVLQVDKDNEQALRRFRAAQAAFPSSLSIPAQIGNIHLEWEEWQAATDVFDGVLAAKPRHPDALIGRAQAVSRLGRYQDGIDTATKLIDGGSWFLGQAHYWRAWNYNALKNNTAAHAEITRTKSLLVNAGVFLLSGLIEWGLEDRASAEREFQEAIRMDFGQCEAAFYLGGVRAELRNAEPAIAALRQAIQCYDLSTVTRRRLIESVAAGPGSETAKARSIGSHQRAIDHNEQRQGQATKLIGQLEAYLKARQPPPTQTPAPPARR